MKVRASVKLLEYFDRVSTIKYCSWNIARAVTESQRKDRQVPVGLKGPSQSVTK